MLPHRLFLANPLLVAMLNSIPPSNIHDIYVHALMLSCTCEGHGPWKDGKVRWPLGRGLSLASSDFFMFCFTQVFVTLHEPFGAQC